jgi:hypothetical protein
VLRRRVGERLVELRRHFGRVPAGVGAELGERDLRAVRWIVLERVLDRVGGDAGVDARREADRQLELGERGSTLPALTGSG